MSKNRSAGPAPDEHLHGEGAEAKAGTDAFPPGFGPDPAPPKKPDALKAARRVLGILLPFSPKRRMAIIQMASLLCEEEA